MNKLEKNRKKINEIDEKMAALWQERMKAAKNIAEYKKENNLPIFDETRENIVISKNSDFIKNKELKEFYINFIKETMDISKKYQEKVINNPQIIFARGGLKDADKYFNLNRKVLILTDDGVPTKYSKLVKSKSFKSYIYTVSAGEDSKTLKNVMEIINFLKKNSFNRYDCLVSVGGGVVCDLGNFIASIYMRGIDFYAVPTTTLAQIDASIGGKTAINWENAKNLVGTFNEPKNILIDVETLKTLDKENFFSGLIEALKMGIVYDKSLFDMFIYDFNEENIENIVKKAVNIKKDVVLLDPKEKSIRKILNFGHTVGHGLELNDKTLKHGEYVGLGMLCACSEDVKYQIATILDKFGCPTKISFDEKRIIETIKNDKKAKNDGIEIIYVSRIGEYEIKKVQLKDIKNSLKNIKI